MSTKFKPPIEVEVTPTEFYVVGCKPRGYRLVNTNTTLTPDQIEEIEDIVDTHIPAIINDQNFIDLVSDVSDLTTTIDTIVDSVPDGITTLWDKLDNLKDGETGFYNLSVIKASTDTATASITDLETVVATQHTATTTSINQLKAAFGNPVDDDYSEALNTKISTAMAEAGYATTSNIDALAVRVTDNEADILGTTATISSLTGIVNDNLATLQSKWEYGSTLDIDGETYTTGFGLVSSATSIPGVSTATITDSEFWVQADKFKVVGATTASEVFSIDSNGNVVITGNLQIKPGLGSNRAIAKYWGESYIDPVISGSNVIFNSNTYTNETLLIGDSYYNTTFESVYFYRGNPGGWYTTLGQDGDPGEKGDPGATPIIGEDYFIDGSTYVVSIFYKSTSAPSAPTGISYNGSSLLGLPSGWSDIPHALTTPERDSGNALYLSVGKFKHNTVNGLWELSDPFSTPIQYSLKKGVDYFDAQGFYNSFIYFPDSGVTPSIPSGGTFDGNIETYPLGWHDNPPNVSKVWVSERVYQSTNSGNWTEHQDWSTPTVWKQDGQDGADGTSPDNVPINGAIDIRGGDEWTGWRYTGETVWKNVTAGMFNDIISRYTQGARTNAIDMDTIHTTYYDAAGTTITFTSYMAVYFNAGWNTNVLLSVHGNAVIEGTLHASAITAGTITANEITVNKLNALEVIQPNTVVTEVVHDNAITQQKQNNFSFTGQDTNAFYYIPGTDPTTHTYELEWTLNTDTYNLNVNKFDGRVLLLGQIHYTIPDQYRTNFSNQPPQSYVEIIDDGFNSMTTSENSIYPTMNIDGTIHLALGSSETLFASSSFAYFGLSGTIYQGNTLRFRFRGHTVFHPSLSNIVPAFWITTTLYHRVDVTKTHPFP